MTHPVFEYRLSYRRMLMLHARLIAAWMLGEVPTRGILRRRGGVAQDEGAGICGAAATG